MDWEKIKRNAYCNDMPPSDWPNGVKPISLEGTSLFGLDKERNLYWDGKRIETKIYFSRTTKGVALITAIFAMLASLKDVLEFFGITNYLQLIGG